jgi:hypothetical protein
MLEAVSRWWADLFNRVLQRGGAANAPVWRRTWGGALIVCFLCTFLRGTADVSREWIEYLPGGLISELALIFLCIRFPFTTHVAFWRLVVFPIVGVWLPFTCQVLSSPPLALVQVIFEKLIGWSGFPRLAVPWAYGHGFLNASACVVMTIVVASTALVLEAKETWRSR